MTISVLALGYFNFQQFNPYRTHMLRWFFNNSGCYRTTSPYNNSSIFTLSFKNCIYTVYLCLLPLLLIVVIVEVIYDLKHLNATNIFKKQTNQEVGKYFFMALFNIYCCTCLTFFAVLSYFPPLKDSLVVESNLVYLLDYCPLSFFYFTIV